MVSMNELTTIFHLTCFFLNHNWQSIQFFPPSVICNAPDIEALFNSILSLLIYLPVEDMSILVPKVSDHLVAAAEGQMCDLRLKMWVQNKKKRKKRSCFWVGLADSGKSIQPTVLYSKYKLHFDSSKTPSLSVNWHCPYKSNILGFGAAISIYV